jgi:hypothetical protein
VTQKNEALFPIEDGTSPGESCMGYDPTSAFGNNG